MKPHSSLDPAALRRAAEARMKQRRATSSPEADADRKRLAHELEVHQIELELQNESLLATRAELQTALDRYTDLYDFAPAAYLTLGPAGEIRQLNLSAATLLGAERFRLVDRRLGGFVCPADRAAFAAFLRRVFASQDPVACEVTLSQATDPPPVVHIEAVRTPSGQECRAVLSNITERNQAEKTLRLAAMVEGSRDAIICKSPAGVVLTWNSAAGRMFGYQAEEIIGQPIQLLLPAERSGEEEWMQQRLLRGETIENYETVRLTKDGRRLEVSVTVSPVKDRAGNLVGASKILRDISERKRAEEQFRQRRELQDQIAKIATTVPGMIYSFRLRPDGVACMPYCTPVIADLWGVRPEDVREDFSPAMTRIHPDDVGRVQETIAESARTMTVWRAAFRVRHSQKGERWLEGHSIPRREPDGSVLWHGFVQDVTEHRQAEEGMRRSEADFRAMFELASVGMAQADPHTGRWLRVNQKMCAITGYSGDEMLQMRVPAITHPEDRAHDWELFQRVVRGETPDYRLEKRYVRKDGSIAWVNVNMTIIRDAAGRPLRTMATIEDITERKRLEAFRQALLSLGSQLNSTVDALGAGRAILVAADRLWQWDAATLHLMTANENEVQGVLRVDTMDGERRELPEPELLVQASPRMRRVMRNGAELILRDSASAAVPDSVPVGNPRPSATIMCVPIRREGMTVGVLSIQSYTPRAYTPEDLQTLQALADYCGGAIARIQMEAVIQAGEERYRGLVETAFDWVWEVGPTGLYTYASSRVRALLGYTPAEVLGRSPFDLMPEAEAQRVGAIFRDLSARREPFSRLENRNRHKNGHEVVLETSGVPMLGPAGELRGYRGMDRDVTEQKQAEVLDRLQHDLTLALAGENNLIEGLRLCLNTAMAATGLDCGGFYLLDESTGALELFAHRGLSPAFVASASHYDAGSPYTRLVMAGQPLYRLFPDIGVPLPEAVQREALRILAVIPLTRHDRVIGCLNIASHTLNGIPATLRRALETIAAGATHAVARLKAEEALLEGQQRLNLALDAARMGMWDWDIVSGRLVWSPNHEALWGYPPGQFPGTYEAFQARVHPDDRSGMQQEGERAGRSRTNFQFDYRVVWPDGSVHWVSSHGRYSFDANGKAIRLVGVVYEITERRQAEDQLRLRSEQLRALTVRLEKLREEERTRMAREVHDVLGQLLTALKMDMSWWERRFTQIPDEPLRRSLEAKVQATSRLADQMIETVQKISRELRPSVLDNIGLGAALQFEARQFQERTGITCEVSVPAELAPLEPEQATGMFRIFQELLTNVARHAQATRIVVRLSRTAEFVTLKVTDNGCGIRAEELNDPQSLGLLGITERASLLGGEFRIRGDPGGGTTATLKVPAKRA